MARRAKLLLFFLCANRPKAVWILIVAFAPFTATRRRSVIVCRKASELISALTVVYIPGKVRPIRKHGDFIAVPMRIECVKTNGKERWSGRR